MAESSDGGDKWDIVILHSDSQYELALAVKESIKSACSIFTPPVRVEVFEDLHDLGTISTNITDEITDNSSIVMFFRCEEFFSEQTNGFGLAAAVADRVSHEDSRRHYTILPLDIGKKTKVRGKTSINHLNGLIVTAEGRINEKESAKIRKYVTQVCNAAASPAIGSGDRELRDQSTGKGGMSEQSIEEAIKRGQSRQQKEIAALAPSTLASNPSLASALIPSVTSTPLATATVLGASGNNTTPLDTAMVPDASGNIPTPLTTPDDPEMRTDERLVDRPLPSTPQTVVSGLISGPEGPTLQGDPKRQSGLPGQGCWSSPPNRPDSGVGRNRPEQNPDADRAQTAAITASVAGRPCYHASSTQDVHLSAGGRETQSRNEEMQRKSVLGDESDSFGLPHSVTPDHQLFISGRPSSNQQHLATDPGKLCHGQQSEPFQKWQQQQQQQQQSQNLRSLNSGPVFSQGNFVPSGHRSSDRHHWNQTGARPKTASVPSAAPALPAEAWTQRVPVSRGQELSPAEAWTQPVPVSRGQELSPAEAWTQRVAVSRGQELSPAEAWTQRVPVSGGQELSPARAERQQAGWRHPQKPETTNRGTDGTDPPDDANLLKAMENLRTTSLTPPPSPCPSQDGDQWNRHGDLRFSDSRPFQNPPGGYHPYYHHHQQQQQKFQEHTISRDHHHHRRSHHHPSPENPQDDLQQDGVTGPPESEGWETADRDNAVRFSSPHALLQPVHPARVMGGESQLLPDTPPPPPPEHQGHQGRHQQQTGPSQHREQGEGLQAEEEEAEEALAELWSGAAAGQISSDRRDVSSDSGYRDHPNGCS